MYSSVCPSCRMVTSTPSTRAIVCTTSLTLTGVPDAKSTVPLLPARRRQREKSVDRVVDIHEVDQVLAVAADRELALAVHDSAQPPRRDLPRRLVRSVCAEEADVHVAADRVAPLGEMR